MLLLLLFIDNLIFRSLRRRWKHWKIKTENTWQQLYPRKNPLKFEVLVFEERGKAEYQEKKPQEARTNNKPSHMGSVWGRLLLRLQEVYNANIQSRLPVITYSRINIYTERKERECSSAVLALSKKKNKKVWTKYNARARLQKCWESCENGSKIVALRFGDHRTKEMLGVVGSKVWPVSNFAQQHATGCANGRNM